MKPPGPPGTSTPTPQENTPAPSDAIVAKTTPPVVKPKPTAQNDLFHAQGNSNVPASEVAASSPIYYATPNPNPNTPLQATPNHQPPIVANEIGVNTPKPTSAWTPPNPNQFPQSSYTAQLKQRIQKLDNVLNKRIQTERPAFVAAQYNYYSPANSGSNNDYGQWSSYGPCSVTCGVGMRRRTRVCRPGSYCSGPTTETRACIKEQCACK